MFDGIWAFNYFSFTVALLIAALMLGHNMPHRKYFGIKAAGCLAVIIGFAFLWEWSISFVDLKQLGAFGKAIGMSRYLIQYFMVLFSMWICFDCNFFAALFCATAAYCMEHISQRTYTFFTTFGIREILSSASADTANPAIYGWLFTLFAFVRILITTAYFLLTYFLIIRRNRLSLSDIVVDAKVQILASTLFIFVAVYAAYIGSSPPTALDRQLNILLSVSCAFLSLFLEFNILFSKKRQNEVKELQNMLQQKSEQYEIEKTNIEQINIKVHDLKHQISALDGKVERKEIQEITDAINIYNSFAGTGNEAIDTILTQKSLYCQKHKIRFTCVLNGKNFDFIPTNELYALFGNAVENAINAVENLEIEKRVISIIETRQGNFTTIRITNYFDGKIDFVEGLPVTSKDKAFHGFGMKSIKLLAEKHGGNIQAQINNDMFILSICLQLENDSRK